MARKPKVLKKADVEKRLAKISQWKANGKHTQIIKTFNFANFVAGLAFAAKVTVVAEVAGHHPELTLSNGRVVVKLTTADVKGLTTKDFDLAGKIDNIRVQ